MKEDAAFTDCGSLQLEHPFLPPPCGRSVFITLVQSADVHAELQKQQQVVEYLFEEDGVVREQTSKQRLSFSETQERGLGG